MWDIKILSWKGYETWVIGLFYSSKYTKSLYFKEVSSHICVCERERDINLIKNVCKYPAAAGGY